MTGLWKGVSDIFEMTGKRKIMAPVVEAIKFSYSAAALAQITLLFSQTEPYKNGASLILPSSIARNSSAPNAKRIFEIL